MWKTRIQKILMPMTKYGMALCFERLFLMGFCFYSRYNIVVNMRKTKTKRNALSQDSNRRELETGFKQEF